MSGRRSFSATVISRSNSENDAPSRTPGKTRKAGSITNALSGPGRPRRSLDSVLGNGNIANRRPSGDSVNNAKHGGKGSQTVEEFDSDANKENIAPYRLVSLTSPSPTKRRPATRRIYSDTFAWKPSGTDLDAESPRVHVIKLASLDVEKSGRELKVSTLKKTKEPASLVTSPRLVKGTTTKTLERNGKVLLRVDRNETDSSDSDSSESDSDSEDRDGRRSEGGVKDVKVQSEAEAVAVKVSDVVVKQATKEDDLESLLLG